LGRFRQFVGKPYNFSRIQQAVNLMKKQHVLRKRKSGEPYYAHPFIVAQKVSHYTTDEDALLGALLHDVVEDTPMTLRGAFNIWQAGSEASRPSDQAE